MTGLPRTSASNTIGRCTGDWACSAEQDGRHCVCVQDHSTPIHRTPTHHECCQCGAPRDVDCIICGQALTGYDPPVTTLGARCANCWTGRTDRHRRNHY